LLSYYFLRMKPDSLTSLREACGLEIEAIALLVNLDPDEVTLLEADPEEALETLDLHQWIEWSTNLGLPLLELIASLDLCDSGPVKALTFKELRDSLGIIIASHGGVEAVEEEIGWELRTFIRNPEDGWSRKLIFFRSVAEVTGCDWRGILAAYGVPV
jgi:hypothetical protein